MAENKRIETVESIAKLQEELDYLTLVKRKEVTAKIKEAKEQGDLSENAEYDAARDEQGEVESRIAFLEEYIKTAEILDESTINFEKIHIGCTVKIQELKSKREFTYQIVVDTEVNSREGKISYNSPIGSALQDKEVGDVVDVVVPAGTFQYKVLDIISSQKN